MEKLDDREILEKIKAIPSNVKDIAFEYADNKITNMLKRYDNPRGKRASLFLKNRIFFEDRGDYFLKYSAVNTKKQGMLIDYKVIYKLRTSKGMIYVYVDEHFGIGMNQFGEHKMMCWTAHHFDQYAMRTYQAATMPVAVKMRAESIEHWFRNEDSYNVVMWSKDMKNIYAPHPMGTSIGIASDKVLLRITFVSKEMLRGNQIETVCAGIEVQSELTNLFDAVSRY